MFKDSFFKKVEDKTHVSKETILSLASKLQNGNMKDEKVLNELVDEISEITGKNVTDDKRKKIKAQINNSRKYSRIFFGVLVYKRSNLY